MSESSPIPSEEEARAIDDMLGELNERLRLARNAALSAATAQSGPAIMHWHDKIDEHERGIRDLFNRVRRSLPQEEGETRSWKTDFNEPTHGEYDVNWPIDRKALYFGKYFLDASNTQNWSVAQWAFWCLRDATIAASRSSVEPPTGEGAGDAKRGKMHGVEVAFEDLPAQFQEALRPNRRADGRCEECGAARSSSGTPPITRDDDYYREVHAVSELLTGFEPSTTHASISSHVADLLKRFSASGTPGTLSEKERSLVEHVRSKLSVAIDREVYTNLLAIIDRLTASQGNTP